MPVAPRARAIEDKVVGALMRASGRSFADEDAARTFVNDEMKFGEAHTYGGATTCLEIEGADDSFFIVDMGSGLRELGNDAFRRVAGGRTRTFNFFMSHLHWDHIMGFPFFGPAFDPNAHIIIHSGHADCEAALRRQQEEISFPVPWEWLKATFEFVVHAPGEVFEAAGLSVSMTTQYHSHDSYGYRFEAGGKAVIYSTDSEHKVDNMQAEAAFEAFFKGADLVICDTMYSLGDTVSLKQDWGHSSNVVAVDLCHGAGARCLALFHHEPTYSDEDIQRMHGETIRYEELVRGESPPLEVICAYDGLEVSV